MTAKNKNTLVYGYGNPGRQDDGLGILFCDQMENTLSAQEQAEITVERNYQLNIEDASTIAHYNTVVFVDATTESIDTYSFAKVVPSDKISFTMHASSPAFILDLCQKLFNKSPDTYLLKIKGYEWELKEGLTTGAEHNLEESIHFILPKLKAPERLKEYNLLT